MSHEIHKNKPRFQAQISHLNHEGRGIASIDGKTTFIFNALPDEEVGFIYEKKHAKFNEGLATEIKTANPNRITPKCQYFGICGGCSLQHMPHDMQLAHKKATFAQLLAHQAHCKPNTWLETLTGPLWGYRNKARLSAKFIIKKDKVAVGFRERKGRFVADIDHCPILNPAVSEKIKLLSETLQQLSIPSHIPQIEVAISDDANALIIRHMKPFSESDKATLQALADTHQFQIYLQPKGPDTVALFAPSDAHDKLHYHLSDYQLKMAFLPQQFTQINSSINQKMLAQAIELLELEKTDHVLDLFCGIGNFTLPIAKTVSHVVGVEGDRGAVDMAQYNAKENQLTQCEFHCADLFSALPNTTWTQRQYDKLVLDPPRSGAAQIIPMLATWQPKRIVYISCNPATLARDTDLIQKQGYTLEKAGIMDMFPHTQHVEAMALFTRNET